jgi:hypothetical protein
MKEINTYKNRKNNLLKGPPGLILSSADHNQGIRLPATGGLRIPVFSGQ